MQTSPNRIDVPIADLRAMRRQLELLSRDVQKNGNIAGPAKTLMNVRIKVMRDMIDGLIQTDLFDAVLGAIASHHDGNRRR